jgi:A/G-specific adenine glycosylase
MLQQTRVETVIPYYERFTARFPTPESLATADEEDVLREWSGLGYYARARNLKRAAELVVRDHDGRIPSDPAALSALPGVGRYTAGAITSIAFGRRAPVVDGNVSRVLSRLQAVPAPSSAWLWELAGRLVPDDAPGDFNQALMELGATICTPRAPGCPVCPLAPICRGRQSGSPDRFPEPRNRRRPKRVRATAAVVHHPRRREAVLMVRRPGRGLLGGLWELPSVEGDDVGALADLLNSRLGLRIEPGVRLGQVSHVFTHRHLTLDVFEALPLDEVPDADGAARWCTRSDLREIPLSALAKKSLRVAGASVSPAPPGHDRRPGRTGARAPRGGPSPGS